MNMRPTRLANSSTFAETKGVILDLDLPCRASVKPIVVQAVADHCGHSHLSSFPDWCGNRRNLQKLSGQIRESANSDSSCLQKPHHQILNLKLDHGHDCSLAVGVQGLANYLSRARESEKTQQLMLCQLFLLNQSEEMDHACDDYEMIADIPECDYTDINV